MTDTSRARAATSESAMLVPSRIASFEPGGVSIQPDCPTCGGATLRRTASSGPRAGTEFWGCANFPACQGSVAVATNIRSAAARLREAAAGSTRLTGSTRTAVSAGTAYGPPTAVRSVGLARPRDIAVPIGDDAPLAASLPHDLSEPATGEPADSDLQPRRIQAMQPVLLSAPEAAPMRQPERVPLIPFVVAGTYDDAPTESPGVPPQAPADTRLDAAAAEVAPAQVSAVPVRVVPSGGPAETAGASAQAEFERRAARHRAAALATLPTIVAVTVIGMAAAVLAFAPYGRLVAAVAAAAVGLVGASFVGRLPVDALRWRSHAAAERRTAAALQPLESAGYIVLHDRTVPGVDPNIDHIAIGPAGVFVIETRRLGGQLAIAGERIFVGNRARAGLVEAAYREAVAVQIALADTLGPAGLTVRPLICVHGMPQMLLGEEAQGLRVVAGDELEPFLRREPTLLGAHLVQAIATLADRRLRPALP